MPSLNIPVPYLLQVESLTSRLGQQGKRPVTQCASYVTSAKGTKLIATHRTQGAWGNGISVPRVQRNLP